MRWFPTLTTIWSMRCSTRRFAESYKVAALDVMNKMRTLSRFRA